MEKIIRQRLIPQAPPKLITKLIKKIERESQIFLNGRMSYLNNPTTNSNLSYYKLLKEIYDIIIINYNTSVSNIFIEIFGRDGSITQKQLRQFFIKKIMADVSIVERHGCTFEQFFIK